MRARLMIAGLSAVAGLCLWMLATAVPASAHHAFAAEFDADRPVEFSGTVTKVEWINPHVWIHIDVNTDAGATENWAFEAGTPNVLFRRGFTRRSLLPGVDVLVDGYQAKDGTNRANGRDITLSDGTKLFLGSSGTGAPWELARPGVDTSDPGR
ncbi:MAG: DUF6152 family protein [Vicinamibacterales bacterium]|jgi:hypothetical protein|nr:DUF6152 family protein [Vicinamibacterales bacterium]